MPISISQILPEEAIDALGTLQCEFAGNRPFFNRWIQQVRADLGTSRRLYKILVDEQTAGWLLIHFVGSRSAKFNALLVYPHFRNRNVGKEVLRQAILELSPDIDWVFTQCREDDTRAIRLVKNVGFVQIGILRHVKENATNVVFAYSNNAVFSVNGAQKLADNLYNRAGEQTFSAGTHHG